MLMPVSYTHLDVYKRQEATAQAVKKPVARAVIARPHEETQRLVELSASRLKK